MSGVSAHPLPVVDATLLNVAIDGAIDCMIVIDGRSIVLLFNRACVKVFGYSPDEVIGRNVSLLMPEPDRSQHDGYLAHYQRTGRGTIIGIGREVTGRRKDGSTVPLYLSIGETRVGDRPYFVGTLHDLTERNRAVEELRRQRDFSAAIFDSTAAILAVLDRDGRFVRINRTFEAVSGYRAAEVLARTPWDLALLPAERVAVARQHVADLVRSKQPIVGETVWITKNGVRKTIHFQAVPLLDGDEVSLILASATDLTARVAAEARLRELENELIHAGRLTALGEMASAIAHELNQPLTAIVGYAEAASALIGQGDPGRLPRARELVDKTVQQANRAGEVIRRMRALAKKKEADPAPLDLNRAVGEACALAKVGATSKGIEVAVDLARDLPAVLADEIQVQQVVLNLVRNSIDALAGRDRPQVRVSTGRDGAGAVAVEVADNGPGLAAAVAARLFDPFVTTKPDGLGIGLSICRTIVEAHGGSIAGTTSEGGGARFRFTLPVATDG